MFQAIILQLQFSQQQSYHVFISYEGAQSLPGHPRITAWAFRLHFKKPIRRHHPFHRRLIPPACLWRRPKFCICKEANENQRKPPLMACHESGSSDTNSSPMKEWQKYGSQSWRTSCCFLAIHWRGRKYVTLQYNYSFSILRDRGQPHYSCGAMNKLHRSSQTSGNKTSLLTVPSPELMTHLCLLSFRFMWVS